MLKCIQCSRFFLNLSLSLFLSLFLSIYLSISFSIQRMLGIRFSLNFTNRRNPSLFLEGVVASLFPTAAVGRSHTLLSPPPRNLFKRVLRLEHQTETSCPLLKLHRPTDELQRAHRDVCLPIKRKGMVLQEKL